MIQAQRLARILFRRRLCGVVEARSVATGPVAAGFGPGVPRNPAVAPGTPTSSAESGSKASTLDLRARLALCESVAEVCDFFSEHRARIQPGDCLLLLSRVIQLNAIAARTKAADLDEEIEYVDPSGAQSARGGAGYFPANAFCATSLDGVRPVSLRRLDPRVGEVFAHAINGLERLDTQQLLYLNRMCELVRGYQAKLVRAHSQDLLGPRLGQMGPVDLVRTGIVLASRSEDAEFVKIYIAELMPKLELLGGEQKMLLFGAMASARRCSATFLTHFAEYLRRCVGALPPPSSDPDTVPDPGPRGSGSSLEPGTSGGGDGAAPEFWQAHLVKLLCVYSRNHRCIPRDLFRHLLARALVADVDQMRLGDVLDLVWVANKLNNADLFLPKAKGYLSALIHEVGPESLAMLIWAYANSGLVDAEFHALLDGAAVRLSHEFTPKNVALCAHSFSLKAVVASISHFNGLDLAMLASAYARVLRGSGVLHQSIQEAALNYVDDLPADCISKLLFAYARIPGKRSLFRAFAFPVLQRMHQFPLHEFVQVMWSYLVARHRDPGFWATCLEVVLRGFEQVVHDPRSHLLYPVLSILSQQKLVPSGGDVARLLNHTRKHFRASQQVNASSAEVSRLVGRIEGVEAVSHCHDEEGFLVDVAFGAGGRRCALLVYNAANTFDGSPTGDMRLKELFLANKGYLIVRILEHVWLELDGDSRLKVIESQLD